MKGKLIYSSEENHPGYGDGSGDTERYEYECPCGKGKIVEEHDNIPGFCEHNVWIDCAKCSQNYIVNTDNGVRNWIYKKSNLSIQLKQIIWTCFRERIKAEYYCGYIPTNGNDP